jgi:hypothetical protein
MRAPWWLIAWRLLWFAPLAVSAVALCLFVFLCYGARAARLVWRENVR